MRQNIKRGIILFVPTLLGLLIGLAFENDIVPNTVYMATYAIDRAWLASIMGLIGSAITGIGMAIHFYYTRQIAKAHEVEQSHYAQKQREFIRRLDHELKNPLTIIQLGALNLQEAVGKDETSQVTVKRIGHQSQRLQRLVAHLRQLSDLESYVIDQQPCNLAEILDESIGSISANKRQQTIQTYIQEVPWKISNIHGDRDLISLALVNILDNALKFTPDDGTVEVRVADDGSHITIDIADNGIGIPEDSLAMVFEELFRASNAKPIEGSGLGLSLVRAIMDLHQGSVAIRSKPNQGTVLTLSFPL